VNIKQGLDERFRELLAEGTKLVSGLQDRLGFWVPSDRLPECQKWLSSVCHLVKMVDTAGGSMSSQCDSVMSDKDMAAGIPTRVPFKMFGILGSASDEWGRGLLRKVEHVVIAEAFDDFLDHAASYHKANKKVESSVLASAVLEDTIKRIASKNGLAAKSRSLETLVDDLVKADVFTPVKAKRVKAFAGVRNKALHAEWDGFDIRDVGEMISGVRELIESFL
jgi:uncharacterized protein YutE (UPF0331/DUF86 family)